jgi:acylphosphatase
MDGLKPERREIVYSGRVQGVGFRWTARQIAQSHAVTGFVRNLDDGRVQLVVEGQPDEIDRLLATLRERMEGHIRQAQEAKSPATGQFAAFEIVH